MERLIKIIFFIFFFLSSTVHQAQNFTVKGKTIDENKKALTGANLLILETNDGTISDDKGNFKFLNLKAGIYHIQLSYVGYEPLEVEINIKKNIDNLKLKLTPKTYQLDSILVSANRIHQQKEDIPGKIDIITRKDFESIPVNNVDDIFKTIPNVQVNRSWGIFSKNSSVTMRGLEGSSRTLILFDGVPMNKSAGGSINWAMLNPDDIERIEVIKGPASALYGNNAMAGVINIISTSPKETFSGSLSALAGTYNTLGTNLVAQSNLVQNNRGFYWNLTGFYRQGDGYLFEPFKDRDSTSAKLFLNEGSIHIKSGYQFNSRNKLEISYSFYEDYRGEGVRVYENGGKFNAITNHYATFKYNTELNDYKLNIIVFFQNEDYLRQSESLNYYAEYKLFNDESLKNDIGLWTSISRQINLKNSFVFGFDLKYGDVNTSSYYKTATDILKYTGKLAFSALFLQYDYAIIPSKLKLQSGIRFDQAKFYNGNLFVSDPTNNTGFNENYYEEFKTNNWNNISPKIALKFFINEKINLYSSVSTGFMPPKLDDLCKSGKIRKGFKVANPELGPEKIITYEIGSKYESQDLKIEPAIYYSRGYDFQYFVGTGESIDSDGESKPIFKRQNISKVEIKGVEIGIQKVLGENLSFNISYAYNYSKIAEFHAIDSSSNNISGKFLMEVSPHNFYTGITYKNNIANLYASYDFVDGQWADDENTIRVEAYSLINLKIYRLFFDKFNIALDIQNILNLEYVDRKGYLSPGRYTSIELKYQF
jgi:iron complex outermembrane recepter protein